MSNSKNGEQVFTNCTTGGPVHVYVKDGKITRIEPLKISPDDTDSWTIEARGKKFSPGKRARLSPYTLAERSRIYASSRLLHPLKRVDFAPEVDRKTGNRGKSGVPKEKRAWE